MTTRTRTRLRRAARGVVAALAVAAFPVAASSLATAATTCPTVHWGSMARESSATGSSGPLRNVRAGRHACYDRLVLDVGRHAPGYHVSYVTTVRTDGRGDVVPLRGGARLRVIARVPAYDDRYRATYTPADPANVVDVTGYRTFRQVAWAGSFEGQTTLGVGVRARLPFRVFTLDDHGSSRLVVDVAHHW